MYLCIDKINSLKSYLHLCPKGIDFHDMVVPLKCGNHPSLTDQLFRVQKGFSLQIVE